MDANQRGVDATRARTATTDRSGLPAHVRRGMPVPLGRAASLRSSLQGDRRRVTEGVAAYGDGDALIRPTRLDSERWLEGA